MRAKGREPSDMREPLLVPDDPVARLRAVLDLSWQVLVSRFVNGRHIIETEAPSQHHFAKHHSISW